MSCLGKSDVRIFVIFDDKKPSSENNLFMVNDTQTDKNEDKSNCVVLGATFLSIKTLVDWDIATL